MNSEFFFPHKDMPSPRTVLRLGLAATFLWIGFLIVRDPASWGALIPPWAPGAGDPRATMFATAVLDLAVGVLLLMNLWTWLGALLGALHLLTVVVATASLGLSDIAARDLGLMLASTSLFLQAPKPAALARMLPRKPR